VAELHAGTTVGGKYRLITRAGSGGMGDVWIACNTATHADVAIKTLRRDRRAIEEAEERFRQEARVSARLNHPNIARVFDLVEAEDGMLFLVMERLKGRTLKENLELAPIAASEAVNYALPILDSLGAAHAAGIVHRDVTPTNIFLAENDGQITPRLIDFGVAKSKDTDITTRTGQALGTPQYMSPEQIRGRVDGRSDLFSLSVVLYEAITGVSPFRRSAASGSLAAVLEADVDPDPKIPPAIWLVLSRGLAKQPYERFESAKEMADALRKAVDRDDEPSTQLSGHMSVPPEPRRSLGRVLVAASLVIALGIGALAVVSRRVPPPPPQSAPAAHAAIATTVSPEPIATPSAAPPPPPETTAPPPKMVRPPPAKRPAEKPIATTPGF
jgi:serine/threonine-protein kinase